MAEIELAALSRQCLDRRLGDVATVRRQVGTWEKDRNTKKVKVQWRFTTPDARIKLRKLYPALDG